MNNLANSSEVKSDLKNLLLDLNKKTIQLNQQLTDRTILLQRNDPAFQNILGRLDEIELFITAIDSKINKEVP